MKVFFTVTYQGGMQFGNYYKMIYEEIKRMGYDHVDDEVVTLTYDEYVKKMSKGRAFQVENYNKKMEGIQKADICVFETSAHSLGLGFMVERSLELSKPTIVLYYEDNVPFFLSGIEDEKLIVQSYDEKNIKKVLKKVFEMGREKRDKRFNFFLSPKLLTYLEQASNTRGVTKSKLLRDMIVQHMRENAITNEQD